MLTSAMEIGIQLKVAWTDPDVIQLRATAWNGEFGGAADPYVGIGRLEEAATLLAGFPRDPSDIREVSLGAFGPRTAGGGISMSFFCIDKSGHARVEVKIQSDQLSDDRLQSVTLWLPIEAAAIDRFVDDLRRLEAQKSGIAYLRV